MSDAHFILGCMPGLQADIAAKDPRSWNTYDDLSVDKEREQNMPLQWHCIREGAPGGGEGKYVRNTAPQERRQDSLPLPGSRMRMRAGLRPKV